MSAEVKIAALYAESGPVSEIAEAIAEAKRVAVETINADGIGIVGRGLISIDTIDEYTVGCCEHTKLVRIQQMEV